MIIEEDSLEQELDISESQVLSDDVEIRLIETVDGDSSIDDSEDFKNK